MPKQNPRVDAYIARSAEFARPILTHLRKLIHTACPDVVETIKWNNPAFEHKGLLCGVAAFKHYCGFGFWKQNLIFPEKGRSMREFGRFATLADLPKDRVFLGYIRKAVELNEAGIKISPRKSKPKPPLVVPDYFLAALKKNKKALATFEAFSPSHKREYVEWLVEAKREETRAKRLKTAIAWLAQGKSRNWKYE